MPRPVPRRPRAPTRRTAPLPDVIARLAEAARVAQGTYYVASGAWPIVHMPSFEAVTGPKREDWLVRTVGALVTVVGSVLLRHRGRAVRELAVGSAATLAAVDLVGVASGRLRPVYLLDAAAEALLIAGWLAPLAARRAPREPTRSPRAADR